MFLSFGPKKARKIDLNLTIRFGEQAVKTTLGTVWFGIRAGILRLSTENCTVPGVHRAFRASLQQTIPVVRTIKTDSGSHNAREDSTGATVSADSIFKGPTLRSETLRTRKVFLSSETTNSFNYDAYQIYTMGPDDAPKWMFQVQTGDRILKGGLEDTKLCNVLIQQVPFSIEAFFETEHRHIVVTNVRGVWPENLSQNKNSVLRIVLIMFLRNYIYPYLSRSALHETGGRKNDA